MSKTLDIGEPHPAAFVAQQFIADLPPAKLAVWQEAFASCSIENNRSGQICGETLRRLMNGEPVSDRYILGLAFTIKEGQEAL